MFSTLYRNINLLILLFIFSSTCFGCQTKDTLYYTNPDKKVAEMIFNKQIVMIGEAPHSHPVGFDGVIKILNEWLKQLQEDASKPQNLTLILETDSSYAFDIDKYFDNGIIDSILDPRIPIENYEFYNNLRYFHEKIDSINKANNSAVSFTVRGFEEVGENFDEAHLLKSQKESELWFVNERDVYTSKGIINYVKQHPEEKILVFYGWSHLQEGLVDKNLGFPDLSDKECMGYYLIYYLRKEFGNENVVSIAQPIMPPFNFIGTPLEKVIDSSIFVAHMKLELNSFRPKDYEYFIFRPFRNSIAHPAGNTFTRVMIEKSINKLKQYEQVLNGYSGQAVYYNMLGNMWLLTGKIFKNVEELEKWYNKNSYNGFERLNSKGFEEQIYNMTHRSKGNNMGSKELIDELGFTDKILDTNYGADSSIWRKYTWPEEVGKVVFLNSIGIYWFGYPDEKVKAKEYLVKFSGQDYAEPEKYLQWYRMKYFGYEY